MSGIEEEDLVIVEPIGVQTNVEGRTYELVSYRDRRREWTSSFGLSWGNYDPVNYISEFSGDEYEEIFDTKDSSLIELEITAQRNFGFGSVSVEFGAGFYSAQASSDYIALTTDDIKVEIIPIRAGLRLNLDTILETPYVVPYASGGVYTSFYTEKLNSRTVEGTTSPAFYYTAGAKFLINWLEPDVARQAYQEYGLENTYIYAEVRQFFESATEADPDFSSDLNYNVGLSFEL